LQRKRSGRSLHDICGILGGKTLLGASRKRSNVCFGKDESFHLFFHILHFHISPKKKNHSSVSNLSDRSGAKKQNATRATG
jgi:hypothetical protein